MLRLINVQFTTSHKGWFDFMGWTGEIAYGDIVDTDKEETVYERFGITNAKWINAFKSGDSETQLKLTDFTDSKLVQILVELPKDQRFSRVITVAFEDKLWMKERGF